MICSAVYRGAGHADSPRPARILSQDLDPFWGGRSNAPLFLVLSRDTRWAGPIIPVGDRDLPIGAGFTAFTYTGVDGVAATTLIDRFSNSASVGEVFAFDNETGAFRVFRESSPAFLNDLAILHLFDVLFVLADGSTRLSLPGR